MPRLLRREYPIELPAGNLIGKHVLEGVGRRVTNQPSDDLGHTAPPLVATPGGATVHP